jgi:uncharacterized membrane protein YbhN (UPF0104 family)
VNQTRRTRGWRRGLSLGVAAAILAGAAWLLYRAVHAVTLEAVLTALAAQPLGALAAAGGCTALSFAALASYDALAARMVVPRIAIWRAALAGAVANAWANALGFPAVTATAIRLRIYGRSGVGVGDVARITALSTATLVLGFVAMLAIVLAIDGGTSGDWHRAIGIGLLLGLAGLAAWLSGGARRLALGRLTLALPPARLAVVQMIVGAAEMAAAIGALYVLLPPDIRPDFPAFSIAYIGAVVLGIGSQAPGGLGVFEAAMTAILGGLARADVLAALLMYRLIYNILPFGVTAALLAWFELAVPPSSTGDSGGSGVADAGTGAPGP